MKKKQFSIGFWVQLLLVFGVVFFVGGFFFASKAPAQVHKSFSFPEFGEVTEEPDADQKESEPEKPDVPDAEDQAETPDAPELRMLSFHRILPPISLCAALAISTICCNVSDPWLRMTSLVALAGLAVLLQVSPTLTKVASYPRLEWGIECFTFVNFALSTLIIGGWFVNHLVAAKCVMLAMHLGCMAYLWYDKRKLHGFEYQLGYLFMLASLRSVVPAAGRMTWIQGTELLLVMAPVLAFWFALQCHNRVQFGLAEFVEKELGLLPMFKNDVWKYLFHALYYVSTWFFLFFVQRCDTTTINIIMVLAFLVREVAPVLWARYQDGQALHFPIQIPFIVIWFATLGVYQVCWADDRTAAFATWMKNLGGMVLLGTLICVWGSSWEEKLNALGWKTALSSGIFGGLMVHMVFHLGELPVSGLCIRSIFLATLGTFVVAYASDLFAGWSIAGDADTPLFGKWMHVVQAYARPLSMAAYALFIGGMCYLWMRSLMGWPQALLVAYSLLVGILMIGSLQWHPGGWGYTQPPKRIPGYLALPAVALESKILVFGALGSLLPAVIGCVVHSGISRFFLFGLVEFCFHPLLWLNMGLVVILTGSLLLIYVPRLTDGLEQHFHPLKAYHKTVELAVSFFAGVVMSIGPAGLLVIVLAPR